MSEWEVKRKAMRHYNCIANVYDALYSVEQQEKFEAILKHLNFEGKELLLDVGCGTGLLFSHLKDNIELLIGVDIAKNILLQAKNHAKQNTAIALVRADADYLPFKDKIFTITFAITLLQNMPNIHKTLEEIKRVTKPEGVIAINGLKKKYSLEYFRDILEKAEMKIIALENKESLKGYLAICGSSDKATKHLKHATPFPIE